jgi:hypothetical protein
MTPARDDDGHVRLLGAARLAAIETLRALKARRTRQERLDILTRIVDGAYRPVASSAPATP